MPVHGAIVFMCVTAISLTSHAGRLRKVVMLGDSTTLSSRSLSGKRLTDAVQAALNQREGVAEIVNAGKGSDTIRGAHARLEHYVFAHAPDLATLSFGLNDSGYLTPGEYEEWLNRVVHAIRERSDAQILLVTSTPFDDERHHTWQDRFADQGGLDHYMDANICETMRIMAKKETLPLCDLHAEFLRDFKRSPKLMTRDIRQDGVHLTVSGNARVARYLAPAIRDALRLGTDERAP